MVGGAGATRATRCPAGGALGTGRDRLLLRRRRGGLGRAPASRATIPAARCLVLGASLVAAGRLSADAGDLAARGAAARRAAGAAWGQMLAASARMYARGRWLFLGIGARVVPDLARDRRAPGALCAARARRHRHRAARAGASSCSSVVALGTALTLLGARRSCRRRRRTGARGDRRRAARSGPCAPTASRSTASRPLLGALLVAVARGHAARDHGRSSIPIAIWLAVRWALIVPVVELEGRVRARRAPPQRAARPPAAGSRWPR